MNLERLLVTQVGSVLLGLVACAPAVIDEPWSPPASAGAGGALAGAGAGGLVGGAGDAGGAPAGSDSGAQGGEPPTAAGGAAIGGGDAGSAGAGAGVGGGGAGGAASGAGGAASGTGGEPVGGAAGTSGGNGGSGESGGAGSGGGPAGGTAGTGGTADAGCPAGAFLCEGFEGYAEDAPPGGSWTRDARGGGQINVETSRPHSGAKALHVTGTMNADRANISTALAIGADTVFVRFMMYTAGYPSSSGVHTRLLRLGTSAGTAAGTPENSYALASYNGTAIEKVNSIYLRDTGTHFNDAGVKNRWVCWEFEIDKTGGVGNVKPHIWVDGRELPLAAAGSASHGMTSPSWDPISIEVLVLGLDGFQSDSVRADFWIDDLVIHSQRVGCPAQ